MTTPSSCGPFTSSTGTGPWYFNVWNTGTVKLTGLSYSIAFNGGVSPTVVITACTVAWTQSSGACSGTKTTVLSNKGAGTYPVTTGVPTSPGSEAFIKATPSGSPLGLTVSTAVCSRATGCADGASSSQVRSAQTTNG